MDATPLLIDQFEPMEIYNYLSSNTTADRYPLNAHGLLDFFWITDHRISIERKTSSDLISSILDGSLEERLKLGLQNADEIGLIHEGIITPDKKGTVIWHTTKDGKLWFKYRTVKVSFLEISAFIFRLDKEGVTTYPTSTLDSTSQFLLAAYNNSKKDEHLTFRRYLKAKPQIMLQDPLMQNIMSIPGIGVERGKELMNIYGTPWAVYTADYVDLVNHVGQNVADKIWKGIGRDE